MSRALTAAASNDDSYLVRYEAAEALDQARVESGHAAMEKVQQEMGEKMFESPAVDTSRLYARGGIFANIPANENHENPCG